MVGICTVCGAAVSGKRCGNCGRKAKRYAKPSGQYIQQLPEALPDRPVTIYNVVPAPVFPPRSYKRRWVAFVLALFLGGLGIHRFYVGKVRTGILWLFTMGFFGIGWFIDVLLTLTGSFKDTYGFVLYK